MHRRYESFEELADSFLTREGTAIRTADELGFITDISYPELASMIFAEVDEIRAECRTVEIIRTEQNAETIVSVLAHIIAGCDVVMAGRMVSDEQAEKTLFAAEGARSVRLTQRDAMGRLIVQKGEGELLFFTSGTTSRSKIVRLTSGALCSSIWCGNSMLTCTEDDVILCILPLEHVFGFVCAMLWGLAYGATIAIGRGKDKIAEDVRLMDPTIIPAVPMQINAILAADSNIGIIGDNVRTVLIGAAPCPAETIAALRQKGIDVYIGYGLTETASGVAITQDLDEPEAMYPCPEADIRIEDNGEVTVATSCMMEGYIGSLPMFNGDRFYTGDTGFIDDRGRLHLTGRKKDVLLMEDGSKMFCPEVEKDLAKLSGISDIAVTLERGRVILVGGAGSSRESLAEAAEEYNRMLPEIQQIRELIISDEPLPRTVTGKIKRYELGKIVRS